MTPFEQTLQYITREIHFMSKDSSGGYNNAIYANKVIEDVCGIKNVCTKVVSSMDPESEVYKFTSGYRGRMLMLFFNISLHDTRMALAELVVEYELIRMSYDKKSVKAAEYLIKLYRKTVKKVIKLLANARSKKKYKKMYKNLEDFVDMDIDGIELEEPDHYEETDEGDFDTSSLKVPKGRKRSNAFLNKLGLDPKTPEEIEDAMFRIEESLGRALSDDEIEAIFFEDDELDEEDEFDDDDEDPAVTEKMIESAVEKVLMKMMGRQVPLVKEEPEEETEHFETMEEFLARTAPKDAPAQINPFPDIEVGNGSDEDENEEGVEIPTDDVSTEELIKYHNITESKYRSRKPDVIKCRPVQVDIEEPDPEVVEKVDKGISDALASIQEYNKNCESKKEKPVEKIKIVEEVIETPTEEVVKVSEPVIGELDIEPTPAVESVSVSMFDMNVEVGSDEDDGEEDHGVEIPLRPIKRDEPVEDTSSTDIHEVPLDPKLLDPLFRNYNMQIQKIFDESHLQDGIGCEVCDSIINLEPSASLDYFITINARLRFEGNFDCFDDKPVLCELNKLRTEVSELLCMTEDKIWIDYQGYFGDEPLDDDLTDLLKNEAEGYNGVSLRREYVLDMYNMAAMYIAHIYNKYAFHAAIGIVNDPRTQKITYILTNVGNATKISDLNKVMGKYDLEMQNTLNTLLDANITLTTVLSLSLNTDFRGFYLDQVKLASPLVQQEVYENDFIDNLHKEVEEDIRDEAEYFPYVDDKGDVRPKITNQYYSTDISHNGYQHLSVETIHSYTTDIAFEKPTDHNDLVDEICVCTEYHGRELERLRALTSNVSVVTKVVYQGISKKDEPKASEKKEDEETPVVAG